MLHGADVQGIQTQTYSPIGSMQEVSEDLDRGSSQTTED